ncbi:hypothetical protein AYL99_04261 [Fonsecaea erecta]|uniref:Uncharacterized protein n=1 Tax=Fonsecaea erecta TaxID=1367422 RepID=A0A178ZQE6_9EURO|nr:hypothetical protein AYL99_04261 [Fonsecaea erecta]OAP62058.1 hypothetical protein AYL99_04261 [Fonsecaea erecta]
MNPPEHISEEDFEYEYDDIETETFFVDIDLSSLNSNIKSHLPVPLKPVTPAKRKRPDSGTPAPGPDDPVGGGGGGCLEAAEPGAGEGRDYSTQEPHQTPSRNEQDDNDDENAHLPAPSRVQILDLATLNPIISYQAKCVLDGADVLRSTDEYDLIGLSRIKLVGQAAKMLKKEKPAEETRIDDPLVSAQAGASGELAQARHDQDQASKQASFLEKLMQVKRQRGETDLVRTFVDERTASVDLARVHESHRDEIQELNVQVLRGNPDALVRLQEIYSQSDGKASQIPESSERPAEAHDEADITM